MLREKKIENYARASEKRVHAAQSEDHDVNMNSTEPKR